MRTDSDRIGIQTQDGQANFFKTALILVFLLACCPFPTERQALAQPVKFPPQNAKRVIFLGDSVTYAGHYVAMIEAQWILAGRNVEVLNLGLPSENCTGLSEPAHPFPRPNVHERLQRCLEKSKPDAIVACYGMNDGIYHPFDESRFQKFQSGIRELIQVAKKQKVALVLLTPPPFDPLPMQKKGKLVAKDADQFAWFSIYEDYDSEVMKPYSEWLLSLRPEVNVIDLRKPMLEFTEKKRNETPGFVMSGDGVHINEEGHELVAKTILKAWGYQASLDLKSELYRVVKQKQSIECNAWLSHIGHKRPKMKTGLPLDQVEQKTGVLKNRIEKLLEKSASIEK